MTNMKFKFNAPRLEDNGPGNELADNVSKRFVQGGKPGIQLGTGSQVWCFRAGRGGC